MVAYTLTILEYHAAVSGISNVYNYNHGYILHKLYCMPLTCPGMYCTSDLGFRKRLHDAVTSVHTITGTRIALCGKHERFLL